MPELTHRALEAAFALALRSEEGAAYCPLLVCSNPCPGSLAGSSGPSSLLSARDTSRASPSAERQALRHARAAGGVGSHPTVGPSTQNSPFPSCWAVRRAEAARAISMQGWQLAGGCGSPHSLYFCCLCHMNAAKTDDVIGSVPPCYSCSDLTGPCVRAPPLPRVLPAAPLAPRRAGDVRLGAPYGLMGTGLVSERPLSSLEMFFFFFLWGRKRVKELTFILSIKKSCLF